jgi:hypothetical protein
MPRPYKGGFGSAEGGEVALGRQAVGLAWAVWVVQHDRHQALTRFALAKESAGCLIVYRSAAERAAHMGARDGALVGVKINRTAIRPDDFDLHAPRLMVGDELESDLSLVLFGQPGLAHERDFGAAGGVLAGQCPRPDVADGDASVGVGGIKAVQFLAGLLHYPNSPRYHPFQQLLPVTLREFQHSLQDQHSYGIVVQGIGLAAQAQRLQGD